MTLAPISRATLDLLWTQLRAASAALGETWRREGRLPRPGPMRRLLARIARRAIAALERTLRQLLALEAAAVAAEPPAPPSRASRPSSPRRAPIRDLTAADPAAWTGIGFRLTPPAPTRRARRSAAATKRLAQVDATALAVRLEALTRALADPAPLIRRMARRLARDSCVLVRLAARRPIAPQAALAQVQRAVAPYVEAMLHAPTPAYDTS